MEIVIGLLSILTCGLIARNWLLGRKLGKIKSEGELNEVEKKLTALSIRRLKIKNDVDRMSLDDLVNRKRDDGGGDNSQGG